ncbi:hypothetical protein C7M84_013851 [Penaeus vannamei]|uniref:Uncharacterized protein n=1 Tax=Penaeus vannamei TaxID=6689 RepID=A0A423SV31_PENVA|nr:hypothetical protein C7M84_013851 [Penaeus vannamei]
MITGGGGGGREEAAYKVYARHTASSRLGAALSSLLNWPWDSHVVYALPLLLAWIPLLRMPSHIALPLHYSSHSHSGMDSSPAHASPALPLLLAWIPLLHAPLPWHGFLSCPSITLAWIPPPAHLPLLLAWIHALPLLLAWIPLLRMPSLLLAWIPLCAMPSHYSGMDSSPAHALPLLLAWIPLLRMPSHYSWHGSSPALPSHYSWHGFLSCACPLLRHYSHGCMHAWIPRACPPIGPHALPHLSAHLHYSWHGFLSCMRDFLSCAITLGIPLLRMGMDPLHYSCRGHGHDTILAWIPLLHMPSHYSWHGFLSCACPPNHLSCPAWIPLCACPPITLGMIPLLRMPPITLGMDSSPRMPSITLGMECGMIQCPPIGMDSSLRCPPITLGMTPAHALPLLWHGSSPANGPLQLLLAWILSGPPLAWIPLLHMPSHYSWHGFLSCACPPITPVVIKRRSSLGFPSLEPAACVGSRKRYRRRQAKPLKPGGLI